MGITISTGNNQFRITFGKSFRLARKFIKGETLIQKMMRARVQNQPSSKKGQASPTLPSSGQTGVSPADQTTQVPLGSEQIPIDAEVYAFLRLRSVNESRTKGIVSKAVIFISTMLISYLAFGLAFSFNSVFILIAVILLHELGHILAMHLFKYRDLQILFLPLLGAASTGKSENVAVWKQVIVYLMGPLPGIILGLVLIILNKNWNAPLVYETAMIMLVINYANLLPILPMDGGHIVRLTVMERFPTGKLIFLGLSIAAFAAGGFFLSTPVFWVLALAMLAAFPMARRESTVLKILNQQGGNIDALDVPGKLRKVFEALKMPQFSKLNFSGKYNLVKSLSEVILQQRHCSMHTAMSLTGVYFAVLLLTPPAIVVSTLGLDSATNKLKIESSEVPAKDWDAEILSTTDSHERFELYIQASQYYSATTDLHKSLNFLKQAEGMANTLNDEDMIARVYHAYALYYQGRGNYAKAEAYLERAIDIGMRRSDKNYLQIATHFQALASLKYQQQNMKDYESDLITALLFAKKIATPEQRYIIGDILGQLLDLYYQQNQLNTVEVLLDQTLKDFDQKDSAPFTKFIREFVHQELGWLDATKGNYAEAVKHYKRAMSLLPKVTKHSHAKKIDPMERANLLLDMAVAQYKDGEHSDAQANLHNAEQLVKNSNFDSLEQYIETYYPSSDVRNNKGDDSNSINLTGTDNPNDTSRESARWRMIHEANQALTQTAINATQ